MRSRSRPSEAGRRVLRDWLAQPRYEVLPVPGVLEEVAAVLPDAVTLTVTSSPARGPAATLEVAEQLAELGHRVVPHLAARQLRDEVELKETVDRLSRSGIGELFVVAGDADRPVGDFEGAVGLLETLARVAPQVRAGVTGYPESHPRIPDDVTIRAMWDKRRHASYIVSQICFDPDVIAGWLGHVRGRGIRLPVLVGVPGPVSTSRLLRVGTRIGVGQSLRFLTGHAGMLRLARPGPYDPMPLLAPLADLAATDPDRAPSGIHLYTFNAIGQCEQWRRRLLDDLEEGAA